MNYRYMNKINLLRFRRVVLVPSEVFKSTFGNLVAIAFHCFVIYGGQRDAHLWAWTTCEETVAALVQGLVIYSSNNKQPCPEDSPFGKLTMHQMQESNSVL